ncbi:MAG: hypothetical protein JSR34_00275 [Proteobacteria bacterium]|nr:hypothetical protein [Pseudomonadota bacterium]
MRRVPAAQRRQSGQIIIMVAILAIVLLLAALLVYNVGRVNLVKTRLQNTADSASYSSALVMARAYNFTAYSNRAMVANQVAIAQMVSLASWSRFYCLIFADSKCGKFSANGTDRAILFGLNLFGGQPGKTVNSLYQNISSAVFNTLDTTTGPAVTLLDGLESVLSNASTVYMLGTALEVPAVAVQVVHDNDPQAAVSGTGSAALAVSEIQLAANQKRYTPLRRADDPGNRFHNVTMASLDPWTSSRSGSEDPPFTTGLTAFGNCLGDGFGGIDFFGTWSGTAALSNDNTQWTANDRGAYFGFGVCVIVVDIFPIPIPVFIPVPPSTGMGIAGGNAGQWQVGSYSGLRSYMGLRRLNQPDWESPTINLFVERKTQTVDTTKQMHDSGQPIAGGQLDMYDSQASGIIQVASSANAYFVRPDGQWSLGGYLVYGNLFNPYWEAHLVKTPTPLVVAADGVQAGIGP